MENHKFLRGSDKSRATFSEMNTLQIFPALILLARLQKTLLVTRARRGAATQRVRPVSYPSLARFYLGLHNAANIMYRKRGQVTVPRLHFIQVEKCSVFQIQTRLQSPHLNPFSRLVFLLLLLNMKRAGRHVEGSRSR